MIVLALRAGGSFSSSTVSEENRRYLRGIHFNGRYTLYNAPIELISLLGEPLDGTIGLFQERTKMYRKHTIFPCEKFDFCYYR